MPASALLVFPRRVRAAADERRQEPGAEGDNRYHAILGAGPAYFVWASSLGPALIALGAKVKIASAKGPREVAWRSSSSRRQRDARSGAAAERDPDRDRGARGAVKNATYEVRQKDALDWPLATASVALTMKGTTVASADRAGPCGADAVGFGARSPGPQSDHRGNGRGGRKSGGGVAKPLRQNAYKVPMASVAVKRALLAAKQKG